MKKFTGNRLPVIITILVLVLLLPVAYCLSPAFAHLIGQPPFLKINGQYANLYPVPLTSLNNFDLPQDLAPDNYSLNQTINFELDKTRLPAPSNIVEQTKFDWDFTDGTHAQGLKLSHAFSRIGSYIIKIYADDGTTPKPQLLESVLVNIVPALPADGPDKNYQLPQAKITVNSQQSKDPLTDILQFSFQDKLNLDASESRAQGSIAEYFWDFGDQKSGIGPSQTHQYPADLSQVFVVLRVKDSNGFLADNFVEIQNSLNGQSSISSNSTTPLQTQPQSKKSNHLPLVLDGLAGIVIVLVMARKFVPGQRRGKRQ